jgi:hypothetical protein
MQEAGEPGVAGVAVILMDTADNIVSNDTTSSGGEYSFENLTAGTYILEFQPPAGYSFTIKDAGNNDSIDSDADPASQRTDPITLAAGQSNLTLDAGLCRQPTISGRAWDDLDHDGSQDSGEAGLAGIGVELLDSSGSSLSPPQTSTTDGRGNYSFAVLPRSYRVRFTLQTGRFFSPKDQGGDDARDSDADTNNGRTDVITVAAGVSSEHWDAGMYQISISGINFA